MPGVVFSLEEKLTLAKQISDFGCDFIELMPAVSKEEQFVAKSLSRENINSTITASTLSKKEHVEIAVECELEHVTLFTSVSDIHLKNKLGISREENIERTLKAIDLAKEQGLKVAFAGEDSTRANIDYLIKFIKAIENKIDYFLPCDTMGCLTVNQTFEFIKKIKQNTKSKINMHCHNDFGLATANTIAGIKAGAEIFSGTFTGIGERAGNAPIEEVCLVLSELHGFNLKLKLENVTKICKNVEKFSGITLQKHKPVVGENAFSHESGTHVHGVLKNSKNYENFSPKKIGQKRNIVFGKHSGKSSLQKIMTKYSKKDIEYALKKLKKISQEKKQSLSEMEIKSEIILYNLKKKETKEKKIKNKKGAMINFDRIEHRIK